MSKMKVLAEQHIGFLNEVLRQQGDYHEGMEFVAAPAGRKGSAIWGYDTTTPYSESSAYAVAAAIVAEKYDFDASR